MPIDLAVEFLDCAVEETAEIRRRLDRWGRGEKVV
jgi:hypothetical protein